MLVKRPPCPESTAPSILQTSGDLQQTLIVKFNNFISYLLAVNQVVSKYRINKGSLQEMKDFWTVLKSDFYFNFLSANTLVISFLNSIILLNCILIYFQNNNNSTITNRSQEGTQRTKWHNIQYICHWYL